MDTRPSTRSIINAMNYKQKNGVNKTKVSSSYGLLSKPNVNSQANEEPDAVRLMYMVEESMNNATAKRTRT